MSEMSDMYKLIMAMRLAKRERVGLGLTYFDVIELLGEFDSLKSYIAELEEIDRMRSESISTLNQANANNEDEIELLEKRIAKLESESERFTAHDATERQDDKWIPVSERLPDGGHRAFYEVACIYQDFGELALFSKGRWVIYEGENVYDVTKRVKFWRKRQYLPDEVIAILSKGETNPEVQE